MFERHILFYSDYCNHSKNFINNLLKHPEIFEDFIRINIDIDPNTKQRPVAFYKIQQQLNYKITEIPTIIVENGEYILTGVEAFKWFDHQTTQKVEVQEELSGFNPIEMGSFSDSYSTFGSNDLYDAKEQTFKFINKPDFKISTPQEDSTVSQQDYSTKQQERERFDAENIKAQQNKNQNIISRDQPILDRSRNSNNQGKYQQNNNNKQQEIDSKLQQLLLERENEQPVMKKNVDFSTGRVLQ
jgi:hypothetical protein